jgi:putative ABC transport system substrate-binding protein
MLAGFCRSSRAQQASKIPRIGLLSPGDPNSPQVNWVRDALKELGYIEGQNIVIEYRWARGRFDRLPELAAELVRLKVDVIVGIVTAASLAAKAATSSIPIVIAGVADPVGVGLAASLARPGGNVTGTSSMSAEVPSKQLQFLEQVAPEASTVAVLWNPANAAYQALALRQVEVAAQASGVQLQKLEARTPSDFDAAFAAINQERTKALLILGDPVFDEHSAELANLALESRVPTMSLWRPFAEKGGLMSFGANFGQAFKRAVVYVDKILKGANPSDLPIEQPTKFELIVNLRTAKALGLTIPQIILISADEVIE